MNFANYRFILQHSSDLDTEQGRQRFVTAARNLRGFVAAPTPYEQMLLDQFVRGNLTFDQVQAFQEKQRLLLSAY